MGKASRWLRLLLSGKKEKPAPAPAETRSGPMPTPPPREKKRWSFRRSVTGAAMEQRSAHARAHVRGYSDSDMDLKHLPAEAAADAVAASRAVAAVIRLTDRATETVEEAAAIRIQSVFRSYLARRALCALRGLVKLQALIRGRLVRQQTTATLRSVQAMVTAQARARTQRIRMLERNNRRSHDSYELDDYIKIVELDIGESRNSFSFVQAERRDQRLPTYSASSTPYKRDPSPARSTVTDRSPGARSGHFAATVTQDYCPLVPSYMANTESSRAKARSHSAPKQRPDSCERPASRRRASVEGHRHPWSIRLDRSSASVQESECGSTSTVLTNTQYARSLMAYETVVGYL